MLEVIFPFCYSILFLIPQSEPVDAVALLERGERSCSKAAQIFKSGDLSSLLRGRLEINPVNKFTVRRSLHMLVFSLSLSLCSVCPLSSGAHSLEADRKIKPNDKINTFKPVDLAIHSSPEQKTA